MRFVAQDDVAPIHSYQGEYNDQSALNGEDSSGFHGFIFEHRTRSRVSGMNESRSTRSKAAIANRCRTCMAVRAGSCRPRDSNDQAQVQAVLARLSRGVAAPGL